MDEEEDDWWWSRLHPREGAWLLPLYPSETERRNIFIDPPLVCGDRLRNRLLLVLRCWEMLCLERCLDDCGSAEEDVGCDTDLASGARCDEAEEEEEEMPLLGLRTRTAIDWPRL